VGWCFTTVELQCAEPIVYRVTNYWIVPAVSSIAAVSGIPDITDIADMSRCGVVSE
jgi:hypothetical protein